MWDEQRDYITTVFGRFKGLLGGGSIVVILAGLYQQMAGQSIRWGLYLGIIVTCLVSALFFNGLEQYRRLLPKLYISGEVRRQEAMSENGMPYVLYYFEVGNSSSGTTIHHVKAQLTALVPKVGDLDWLPVPLHIKHDNYAPLKREFILNPHDCVHIDLVSAPVGGTSLRIWHIAEHVNQDIGFGKFTMTVVLSGENVQACRKVFTAWLDNTGLLECESDEG